MTQQVVVIGGGVGGLAAAIRLAAAGLRVTLLEKNSRVGGKLNLWEVPHPHRPGETPFRFDTGPSLLTLPFVFEQLFAAAGEKFSDHLDLIKLDPILTFPMVRRFSIRNQSHARPDRAGVDEIRCRPDSRLARNRREGQERSGISLPIYFSITPPNNPCAPAGLIRAGHYR